MKKLFTLLVVLLTTICANADVTFTSGTKITFDATAYGSGMNIYIPGTQSPASPYTDWWASTSSKITFTLTEDWTVTTSTKLFKSDASGWQEVYATTLPTDDSYTVLTTTDGNTYTWSQPSTEPSLDLITDKSSAAVGTAITLTATANNFATAPTSYTFTYTKDGGAETAVTGDPTISDNTATIAFTPTETGSYTFKVATDKYSDTKTVTVSNYTWQIHGTMTDEKWASTDFVEVEGTKTATCTFESLATGTYYFGIKRNLNGNQDNWYAATEATTITASTTEPLALTDSSPSNFTLQVIKEGGPYAFTLDYTNADAPTLSVSCPEMPTEPTITLTASAEKVLLGDKITLKAYTLNLGDEPTITYKVAIDGGEATVLESTEYTPAAAGSYVFTAVAKNGDDEATSNEVTVTVNAIPDFYLLGSGNEWTALNEYKFTRDGENDKWSLNCDIKVSDWNVENGGFKFGDSEWKVFNFGGSTDKLTENVAYTLVSDGGNMWFADGTNDSNYTFTITRTEGVWSLMLVAGSSDIQNVAAETLTHKDGKFIENGRLIIIKAGRKFNAAGQVLR